MKLLLHVLFVLALFAEQYISTPVSNENAENQGAYEDVKELESLKNENGKRNISEHTHQVDSSQVKSAASASPPVAESEIDQQQKSRSAIFRHRGITQAKKSNYWNGKVEQPNEGYTKYAGIQYSPMDLAEYVFSTGDEEGVAVAVEELVREGMMGRTDAINYLQDVKQILEYMREQYEQQKKLEELKSRAYPKLQVSQRLLNPPREQFISDMGAEKREPKEIESVKIPVATTEHPHQEVIASTSEPKGQTYSPSTTAKPKTESSLSEVLKSDDCKRMMLMKEKEDDNDEFPFQVIYKMANYMFNEIMIKDNPIVENTISRVVTFMENEVEDKKISPEMKQKVLGIITKAFVDSLRQYQNMMPENQVENFDEGNFYRHMAGQNGISPSKMNIPEVYRKLAVGGIPRN